MTPDTIATQRHVVQAGEIRWTPFTDDEEQLEPADYESLHPESVNVLCLDDREKYLYIRSLQADGRALRDTLHDLIAAYIEQGKKLATASHQTGLIREESRAFRVRMLGGAEPR